MRQKRHTSITLLFGISYIYIESPQTGYRWRGHFSLAHLLHRRRVLLPSRPGQSAQRTRDLSSAVDSPGDRAALPRDGISQTVVIKVEVTGRKEEGSCDWAQGVMRASPNCSMYMFLCRYGASPNHIFTANDVRNYACCIQHPIHGAQGPVSGLPRAGVDCTHLVERVYPSFGGIWELGDFWLVTGGNVGLGVLGQLRHQFPFGPGGHVQAHLLRVVGSTRPKFLFFLVPQRMWHFLLVCSHSSDKGLVSGIG